MSNPDFPHKCPACGSDAYIGLTLTECTSRTCDNYKSAETTASAPSAQTSTEKTGGLKIRQTVWNAPKGGRPSGSPGGAGTAGKPYKWGQPKSQDDYDGGKDTDPFGELDIDWTAVQIRLETGWGPNTCGKVFGSSLYVSADLWEEANRRQKAATSNLGPTLLMNPADYSYLQAELSKPRPRPTKQVTASKPLSEVHEALTEGEKSQLQQLARLLRLASAPLEDTVVHLDLASGYSTAPYPPSLSSMLVSLSSLRAKLPELEDTLEQCDQFLHRLQSGDQHPSENHKSEDMSQMDTVQCLSCGANLSTQTPYNRLQEWDVITCLACGKLNTALDYLSSTSSNSQSQSCETQPREHWTDYAHCTYLDDSQGFEKGLSLAPLYLQDIPVQVEKVCVYSMSETLRVWLSPQADWMTTPYGSYRYQDGVTVADIVQDFSKDGT